MASSEVDQKFLGRLAKAVENDNPLLASMLFKILGLSINLSQQLVQARKQRRADPSKTPELLELNLHIIWLSREGLVMLEQYVLPVVSQYVELKVLAYKLRASFYHIFALFHNQPPVSAMSMSTPRLAGSLPNEPTPARNDKGKGVARGDDAESDRSSLQPTHPLEGGPVGPPPGFGPQPPASFLLPSKDYLPVADEYFRYASALADSLLWGSHSLRMSVKTEYAAFLYECVHDYEGSRKLAKNTIAEVYSATEGIDNDMFSDACELVTVLTKMSERGLQAGGARARSNGHTVRAANPGPPPSQPQPPQPPHPQHSQHPQQSHGKPAPLRTSVPPPMSASAAAVKQAMHPGDMPEFI